MEARWIIETLAFENGNSQCKRVISLLKVRLALLGMIRDTIDIQSHDHDGTWIGQVIFKEKSKH